MQIDARNKACPQPVVMAVNALRSLSGGEVLEVLVNDEVAVENLKRMAAGKGYPEEVRQQGSEWTVVITKQGGAEDAGAAGAGAAPAAEETISCGISRKKELIVVATDQFGQGSGNPALGKTLMKNYLYALAQQDVLPDWLIFINGGAFLTSEGSESLEDLKSLESRGVKIFTCGICADFYGVKSKIKVGVISNMYDIARMMQEADKVVRI